MNKYENKLFCSDNLLLMTTMPDECLDLIYCDILFNTGKKFDDYDDNLGTTTQAIEWYKPRLMEMKRLLKGTGSLYIHCDYRLSHYIKVELDKIFGQKNFKNEIIWAYRSGGASKKKFSSKHDVILFYTKTDKYTFNPQKEKSFMAHKYGFKGIEEFYDEEVGKWYTMANMRDVWNIDIVPNKSNSVKILYNSQKPEELMRRIILASSNEGDLVADFFCGSGGTCKVAKDLGRKYLGCDINPRAIEITTKRLEEELDNGKRMD